MKPWESGFLHRERIILRPERPLSPPGTPDELLCGHSCVLPEAGNSSLPPIQTGPWGKRRRHSSSLSEAPSAIPSPLSPSDAWTMHSLPSVPSGLRAWYDRFFPSYLWIAWRCFFVAVVDLYHEHHGSQYRIDPATILDTRARRRETDPSSAGCTRLVRRTMAVWVSRSMTRDVPV